MQDNSQFSHDMNLQDCKMAIEALLDRFKKRQLNLEDALVQIDELCQILDKHGKTELSDQYNQELWKIAREVEKNAS